MKQLRRRKAKSPATRRAESSLYEFVKQAWPLMEPGEPFLDNWHIPAICRHLEHATATQHYKLRVNIPPGCMKSYLVNVFWPCWVWGPYGWPESRWLFAAYSQELSTRDSLKCRQIIESPWYQQRWGDVFRLASDANLKTYFQNDHNGWRMATSVGGRGTGEHPDFKCIDDPHNVRQAESEAERQQALDWYDGTLSTRGRPRGARTVLIMQRLHENDLSGHIEAKGDPTWDHICLPMRYESDRMEPTSLGWTDPRENAGELLWPELYPEDVVSSMEADMLSLRAAGQLQQRPAPPGGEIFRLEHFQSVRAAPRSGRAVRYWDLAHTSDGGDFTVGVLMVEHEGLWYIADVVRGQWSWAERDRIIEDTAARDWAKYRDKLTVWVEEEPAAGKDVTSALIQKLAGYTVKADKVSSNKQLRWEPYGAQLEAGNVRLVQGHWNDDFVNEHLIAPNGDNDDQIDAAAGAFNKLTSRQTVDLDEWVKHM